MTNQEQQLSAIAELLSHAITDNHPLACYDILSTNAYNYNVNVPKSYEDLYETLSSGEFPLFNTSLSTMKQTGATALLSIRDNHKIAILKKLLTCFYAKQQSNVDTHREKINTKKFEFVYPEGLTIYQSKELAITKIERISSTISTWKNPIKAYSYIVNGLNSSSCVLLTEFEGKTKVPTQLFRTEELVFRLAEDFRHALASGTLILLQEGNSVTAFDMSHYWKFASEGLQTTIDERTSVVEGGAFLKGNKSHLTNWLTNTFLNLARHPMIEIARLDKTYSSEMVTAKSVYSRIEATKKNLLKNYKRYACKKETIPFIVKNLDQFGLLYEQFLAGNLEIVTAENCPNKDNHEQIKELNAKCSQH